MSLRLRSKLESSSGALVGATLVVTLAAVVLALFPAVAEAQTEDESTSSIVVRPGDSLWSISEERLDPNATPQRIVNATEQIYALNRERIGADPNLIFVGQELLVPPVMSERPTGARPAHKTTRAVETGPRDQTAKSAAGKAPRKAPVGADSKGVETSRTVAEREAEPAIPPVPGAATPVPAVGAVASNDAQPSSVASFLRTIRTEFASAALALAESFFEVSADAHAEGRRLLGLGVIVLTLVVAALMVWKLPMRRTTRWDAERWGMPVGYHRYYEETPVAYRITPSVYHPGSLGGSLGDRNEQDAQREAPGALGRGRRALLTGGKVFSRLVSSARLTDGNAPPQAKAVARKAVARNGRALGVHNPEVRRALQRAHTSMRAREPRSRRRASRRLRPPVGVEQRRR